MFCNYQTHAGLCIWGPYVRLAFVPNMLSSWNKVLLLLLLLLVHSLSFGFMRLFVIIYGLLSKKISNDQVCCLMKSRKYFVWKALKADTLPVWLWTLAVQAIDIADSAIHNNPHCSRLTHIWLMDFSIPINLTSPFPNLGVSGVYLFYFNRIPCKQTVWTPIRLRRVWSWSALFSWVPKGGRWANMG